MWYYDCTVQRIAYDKRNVEKKEKEREKQLSKKLK
jgi:hypothetical protein